MPITITISMPMMSAPIVTAAPLTNYIMTPDGVVEIPDAIIARNKKTPLRISTRRWEAAKDRRFHLSSSLFIAGRVPKPRTIVCLVQRRADGAVQRCIWCVRFAVDGGSPHDRSGFGGSFLWQIDYRTCLGIVQDIKSRCRLLGTPLDEQTRLVGSLQPTSNNFNLADWPECRLTDRVPCFYDQLFSMAMRAAKKPLTLRAGNYLRLRQSFARPYELQGRGGVAVFDFKVSPDNLNELVMLIAAVQMASSWQDEDHAALLVLRLVSRDFKKHADSAAASCIRHVLGKVKTGVKTARVDDIFAARDAVMRSGLSLFPLLLDDRHNPARGGGSREVQRGVLSWMRLRSGKRSDAQPPARERKRHRELPQCMEVEALKLQDCLPCSSASGYQPGACR